MTYKDLRPTIDFINEFSSDEAKERFGFDDILYDISMKIFEYRMKNNLSQKDLASKLEVTQSIVSKLESGQHNFSIYELWMISKKINLDFIVYIKTK